MRIRLAILENDIGYLKRIVSVFNSKYSEKIEIYSFTDYEVALNNLAVSKIDVLIASDVFEVDCKRIPQRCGFAYFVDSPNIDSVKNQVAICKFQKADLIYKQILSLYSEKAADISGIRHGETACKLIAFSSVAGGQGTSTVAASCAVCFAQRSKRTLYLNLENFGSSDDFFDGDGQFTMSDVVYALKSKKSNIKLKLESSLKQDASGVCFFSQPKSPLDMMELNIEDKLRLLSELQSSGDFDYIVVDVNFGLDKETIEIFKKMQSIVLVEDGCEISNSKFLNMYNALSILENSIDISLINRISLIYNKFSNKTSKQIEGVDLKIIGGAPRILEAGTKQIIMQLASMSIFDELE